MSRCAASTSRIASLTATPASTISPSIAITPIGLAHRHERDGHADQAQRNGAESTVTGCSSDSNVPASTMNTSTSASSAAQRSSDVVCPRSPSSPARSAESPAAAPRPRCAASAAVARRGSRDVRRDARRDLRDAALVAAEDLARAAFLDLGDVADRDALAAARADRQPRAAPRDPHGGSAGRRRAPRRPSSSSSRAGRRARSRARRRAYRGRRPGRRRWRASTKSAAPAARPRTTTARSTAPAAPRAARARAPRPAAGRRSNCPRSRRRSGGPLVPSARASAVLPTSHETSAPYSAATAGRGSLHDGVAALAARGEPQPELGRVLLGLLLADQPVVVRQPADLRQHRFEIVAAASRRIVSMTATVSAVDSTRCPGGLTTRTLNCARIGRRQQLRAEPQQRRTRPPPRELPSRRATVHGLPRRPYTHASRRSLPGSTSRVASRGKQPNRERRDQQHRDDERDESENTTVKAMPETSRAAMPSTNTTGRNTTQCVERARDDGARDVARAGGRGDVRRLAGGALPEDALHDDDRVVDEHAGAEREPAERQEVQAVPGEAHHEQRREQRHRDGGRDDDDRPGAAQEHE